LAGTKSKKGKPMYKKLAEEILAAYGNQGYAVKYFFSKFFVLKKRGPQRPLFLF
jgi:hypothetical protein